MSSEGVLRNIVHMWCVTFFLRYFEIKVCSVLFCFSAKLMPNARYWCLPKVFGPIGMSKRGVWSASTLFVTSKKISFGISCESSVDQDFIADILNWLINIKYKVSLKTLLRRGKPEPEFCGSLVYQFSKIAGKSNFLDELKNITCHKKMVYNMDIIRQTACLVFIFNPVMVDGYTCPPSIAGRWVGSQTLRRCRPKPFLVCIMCIYM